MRADIREAGEGFGVAGSRRWRTAAARISPLADVAGLEPHIVDEALADETMSMSSERGSRRDSSHRTESEATGWFDGHVEKLAEASATADNQLLQSLAEQLDLLHQQQREIRLLLDQAGRRRVDRIVN